MRLEQAPRATSVDAAIRDTHRLDALRHTALLDSGREEAFDRLTRLAATILRAPIALVSLVDADRQFFKSAIGLAEPVASERETPLSHSFCQHTVTSGAPLIIADAREHPLVRDNPAIPDLGVVAYAGIPLVTSDGHVLGSFCVIDHQPRVWTAQDIAILNDLAAAVMTEIELRVTAWEATTRAAEREELLARAQGAQTQAEAAVRLRNDFLTVAAHDLRTPLTNMLGRIQLVERRLTRGQNVDPPWLETQLESLSSSTKRMLATVSELGDMARVQMGEALELEMGDVDLAALARVVVDEATLGLGAHGVEATPIVLDAPEAPMTARGDSARLQRVLHNIVGNAMKYSPRGAPVFVSVRAGDSDAVITVCDEGVGIPASELPRIFTRYYRASTARGIAGSGIGLSGAKAIVEQHGGVLSIESDEGRGTTVTIVLPRASS